MPLPLRNMGSAGLSGGGAGRTGSAGAKLPGKDAPETSRADKRMNALKESMQMGKSAAKSAAHAGVVARPMDKNLSKILENRRAEMKTAGTSVARLGKEDAAGSSSVSRLNEAPGQNGSTSVGRLGEAGRVNDLTQSGTSVARLGKNDQTPSYLPPPPPKPNTAGNIKPPVDLFGDL